MKKENTKMIRKETLIKILFLILIIGGILFLVNKLFFISIVSGNSMSPTLYSGDYMINLYTDSADYYDVIIFRTGDNEVSVKRVYGLPGDEMAFSSSDSGIILTRNGQPVEDVYCEDSHFFPGIYSINETFILPKDSYFVMGDNRNYSTDSRSYGFIRAENIIGKLVFVISEHKDNYYRNY